MQVKQDTAFFRRAGVVTTLLSHLQPITPRQPSPRMSADSKEGALGPFAKPPILIGGCGRSGTTLLLSVLSAHPEIFCVPEEMFALWPTKSQDEFAALVEAMTRKISAMDAPFGCKRWCEKTPRNVRVFGQLINHFDSDVKLIHLVRDGRDVVTSMHPSEPNTYWVPIWRWVWDVEAGLEYEHHPSVLTVRYEDLVASFDETTRAIFDFLEVPRPPQTLQWHENSRIRRHSALDGDIAPLYGSSVGRWRRPEFRERVDEFMSSPNAVQLLERLGYR